MGLVINIIISGLISGSVYALLAIGFSLIFGVARIVNIAPPPFICWLLIVSILSLTIWASILFGA